MNYLEFRIRTNDMGVETLTASLLDIGIKDTQVESPSVMDEILSKKSSYEWDYIEPDVFELKETFLIFYTEEDKKDIRNKIEEIIEGLKEFSNKENIDLGPLTLDVSSIDDEDWMNSYKEHFSFTQLTNEIYVVPTWEKDDIEVKEAIDNGKIVIYLDPGMAFGTGHHETTAGCIRALSRLGCTGKSVLDVGTGSGILAIAASKLGAEDVLGIDIDKLAVEVSKENISLNNEENIKIIEGDLLKGIEFKADIIVANLMAEIIIMLLEAIPAHLNSNGRIILSGILREKENMVIDELENRGFQVLERDGDEQWVTITAFFKDE